MADVNFLTVIYWRLRCFFGWHFWYQLTGKYVQRCYQCDKRRIVGNPTPGQLGMDSAGTLSQSAKGKP